MQRNNNQATPPMLNQSILELNGILNVNQNPKQRQSGENGESPLQPEATAANGYVHPIITPKDFKQCILRYNLHIKKFNLKVWMENSEIRDYNKKIISNRQQNKPNTEQKVREAAWKAAQKELMPKAYNLKVEKYNIKNGPQLRKKNIRQEVKPESEKYFIAFLHQLNMQLFRRKDFRNKLEVHVPGEIPKVDIYPNKIVEAERDGYKTLPVSVETVKHHRDRLEEAGVLLDYQFRGPNRAVKMRFAPEILCITDNHAKKTPPKPKNAPAENQIVTAEITNKVQYNNVSNRTCLNKFQIKANVEKHSNERSSGKKALTPLYFSSIGNTREQGEEKNDAAAEKNQGPPKKLSLSQHLREKIEDPEEFVQDLAAHAHDKYTPIRIEILEKEAYGNGTLGRDEFKELVLQDFFKTAAKLWKDKAPYPGSWMIAYNTWMREKFITYNGNSSKKHVVFEKIEELRHILTSVGRYCKKHPDFNLLFPNQYFDVTRSTPKEGGFEYALRRWEKRQRSEEKRKQEAKKAKTTAKKRKRRLDDRGKVDKYVQGFLKGKFDFQKLFEKVNQVGNQELSRDLPEIVRKANEKFQFKKNNQ